ncbi:MAG: hypothetical protein IJ568_05670 [Bacilli bacterium]|nr:hypothetical protein [Bacilli bacterium]
MAEHKGAIKIDTKLNVDSIRQNFKEIDTKTKNMINQFNKSVDSIRGQELALDKVKRKLEEERNMLDILQSYANNGPIKEEDATLLEQSKQKVQDLTTQYELMSSKLSETKRITSELGESIKENLNQKANLLGIQKGIDNVETKLDKFKNRMTRLVGTVMVFSLLRRGLTSLRNKFSELLKTNDEYNSSLNQIKANLMTAFAPIYNACLPAINSLMSALSKLTGTIAVFISGLFGKSLKQSKKEAEALSKSLKKTADSGKDASNSLSSIDEIQNVDDDKSSGGSSGDSGIDYSGELQYSQKLLDILNNIKKWIEDNQGLVIGAIGGITTALILMKLLGLDPILSLGIGLIIAGVIALIKDFKDFLENPTWENFGKVVRDIGIIILGIGVALTTVLGIAVTWPIILAGVIAIIVGLVIQNWDIIKGVLGGIGNWIMKNVIEPIKGFFAGLWEGIVTSAKSTWHTILNLFSKGGQIFNGVKEGIINSFRGIVNSLITGINRIIATPFNKVNNLLNTIKNTSFLGISPFKGLWKYNPLPVPQIPRLAQGDVIPPNSEFMAILGDQKRGVNIETPLSTMLEAFNKALDSRDGGITTDLLLEIIQLLNNLSNKETVMTVDGNRFAQLMTKYFDREQKRLNKSTAIEVR